MICSMAILAYLGPETMLPMTSLVAAVAGVVMLLGRRSIGWASGAIRGLMSLTKRKRKRIKPPAVSRKIGRGPVDGVGSKPRNRDRVES